MSERERQSEFDFQQSNCWIHFPVAQVDPSLDAPYGTIKFETLLFRKPITLNYNKILINLSFPIFEFEFREEESDGDYSNSSQGDPKKDRKNVSDHQIGLPYPHRNTC